MKHKLQGVIRPLVRAYGGMLIFALLVAPAAFSQKQKIAIPETAQSESVAETNERIASLALASSAKMSDYLIGSGDLLGIEVFDVPELSRDVRVNETGYISLPLIREKVQVDGLTSFQLQDEIAELLRANGLVSAAQVTVVLKEQHSQPVTVTGAVRNPTVIQIVRQTTLLQALSQAGGISAEAGNTVLVRRPPLSLKSGDLSSAADAGETAENAPQTFTVNLNDLIESGDPRFNIPVLGGDVISVPRAGIIYVVGAVNRPGGFVIQNDPDRMTALKILSLAGGPTRSARTKNAVILRKNLTTGKRDEVPLNLNGVMKLKSEDVALEASDIIFVPDSAGMKALDKTGDISVGLVSAVALLGISRF